MLCLWPKAQRRRGQQSGIYIYTSQYQSFLFYHFIHKCLHGILAFLFLWGLCRCPVTATSVFVTNFSSLHLSLKYSLNWAEAWGNDVCERHKETRYRNDKHLPLPGSKPPGPTLKKMSNSPGPTCHNADTLTHCPLTLSISWINKGRDLHVVCEFGHSYFKKVIELGGAERGHRIRDDSHLHRMLISRDRTNKLNHISKLVFPLDKGKALGFCTGWGQSYSKWKLIFDGKFFQF